ncbi:ISL3 family transposase [Microvirga sp. HBU67558]|uniref:ISL3 family transposase n=1 Tax=Microvirga sp. HBU67558 TaxID=2824562 RepID=UPI001B37E45D|nr:ISL3 family transposase [Microvirga sp. HBU67558]MBQ0820970.1 ISL3 family transposase [Microvirga sp. HBU67558]
MSDLPDFLDLEGVKVVDWHRFENQYAFEIEVTKGLVREDRCKNPPCRMTRNGPRGKPPRFTDLPINKKWVELILKRQLYRCKLCKVTAKDPLPASLHPIHKMTMRLFRHIGEANIRQTDEALARELGLSTDTISRVFKSFSDEVFASTHFDMPEVLGFDEKFWLKKYCCVIGNIKERTLINILPSRSSAALDTYFESRRDRHKVKVVCLDMRSEFHSVARRWFPDAAIVLDRFHVESKVVAVLEQIRKAEAETLSKEERLELKHDAKLLLLRGGGNDEDSRERLSRWFDRLPRLAAAYWAKERFANMYDTKCSSSEAKQLYKAWKASIPNEIYRDFFDVIKFVNPREDVVFAYWDNRFTTNYLEGINRSIEGLKWAGSGYSFDKMRAKILLAHSTHKLEKRPKFRRMDLSTKELRPGFFNSLGGAKAGEMMTYYETVNYGASIDKLIEIFDTPGGFEGLDPFKSTT